MRPAVYNLWAAGLSLLIIYVKEDLKTFLTKFIKGVCIRSEMLVLCKPNGF